MPPPPLPWGKRPKCQAKSEIVRQIENLERKIVECIDAIGYMTKIKRQQ